MSTSTRPRGMRQTEEVREGNEADMCDITNPCGNWLIEDRTFARDAAREGLHNIHRFTCLVGHSLMIGAPPERRGWLPVTERTELSCRGCGEPIRHPDGRAAPGMPCVSCRQTTTHSYRCAYRVRRRPMRCVQCVDRPTPESLRRRPRVRGERNGRAKLTAAQADEIRARRRIGISQQALAAEYHVSKSLIHQVEHSLIWKQGR